MTYRESLVSTVKISLRDLFKMQLPFNGQFPFFCYSCKNWGNRKGVQRRSFSCTLAGADRSVGAAPRISGRLLRALCQIEARQHILQEPSSLHTFCGPFFACCNNHSSISILIAKDSIFMWTKNGYDPYDTCL
ncbi:hypothetical protein CEXT_309661 [Caerostris extrusa]|uniref:Uncharacterized protein n=1 Tax=Caerostris extrusa TaxID=172846 RepID=A0AAV4NGE9_CAEEX|nr:hypothetical protein CEXT_309661 [Caerostris extrusa]